MDNAVLSSNDYLQATVNEGDKVLEDWLQAIKLKEAPWEDGYLGESIDHTRKTGLVQETLNCEEEQMDTETWTETVRMHEAAREKECSGEDMSLEQWLEAVKLQEAALLGEECSGEDLPTKGVAEDAMDNALYDRELEAFPDSIGGATAVTNMLPHLNLRPEWSRYEEEVFPKWDANESHGGCKNGSLLNCTASLHAEKVVADLNNLFVEMHNEFDSAMTEKIKEFICQMQNINDNHHCHLGDKCNETKIVRTKIDECLRVVNGSRGEGNEEDSRRKWDDLDKIFVLAYTIRERVEEEKYYLEDKNHSTMQYELEKYYMDNERIDTKDNYDLGQSKQYLADYILKTLEILNTGAIAQEKENKH